MAQNENTISQTQPPARPLSDLDLIRTLLLFFNLLLFFQFLLAALKVLQGNVPGGTNLVYCRGLGFPFPIHSLG